MEVYSSGMKIFSSGKNLKIAVSASLVVAVIALGSTLAASINLNTGKPVEFGQGVAQTTACDSQIVVLPTSGFLNETGAGVFALSQITLSDIANSCAGKRFRINVYNGSGDILNSNGPILVDYLNSSGNSFALASNSNYANISSRNFDTLSEGLGTLGSTSEIGNSQFTVNGIFDNNSNLIAADEVERITVETSGSPESSPTNSPSNGEVVLSVDTLSGNWFKVDASNLVQSISGLNYHVEYNYYESNSLISASDQSTWPTPIDITSFISDLTGIGEFNPTYQYHLVVATVKDASNTFVSVSISNVLVGDFSG